MINLVDRTIQLNQDLTDRLGSIAYQQGAPAILLSATLLAIAERIEPYLDALSRGDSRNIP